MGKAALSNYLLQSAVLGLIFTGYGFGLIDQLAPVAVIAIVPSVWLAAHGARARELLDQAARDQRCEQRLAGDDDADRRDELLGAEHHAGRQRA